MGKWQDKKQNQQQENIARRVNSIGGGIQEVKQTLGCWIQLKSTNVRRNQERSEDNENDQKPEEIANLRVKFNVEETFKRSKRPKCMLMPVEVYKKTEGTQWIETKKQKGKLIFIGKNCLHGSECEKLRLFERYCEGREMWKQEKKEKGEETGKLDTERKAMEENKSKKEKESEGKEEKKYNANK